MDHVLHDGSLCRGRDSFFGTGPAQPNWRQPSLAEGPLLNEEFCSSFVGRWPIPLRHSCTLGELALYFRATRLPELKLEVVPCGGWDRRISFFEACHPFIPTSPAIRDAETALFYPGTGLLEGVMVSEGRGTKAPFRQAGAPWIDPEYWLQSISGQALQGVGAVTVEFVPDWGLFQGEKCRGLRFHISNASLFRPVLFGIELVRQLLNCFGEKARPRYYHTVANPTGAKHLDLLLGIPDAYGLLKQGCLPETNIEPWWSQAMRPFLLY